MGLFLAAIVVLVGTGLTALLGRRESRWPEAVAFGGCVLASALGLVPAVQVLSGEIHFELSWPWLVPFGRFELEIDPLSAWFVLPVLLVGAVTAVYGRGYLGSWRGRKWLGGAWCQFNLLVASLLLVVTARNALLFLVAWEVMSIASFLLVTFHDEEVSVRDAGWTYLVATHLGTTFLLVLFVWMACATGSMSFADWTGAPAAVTGHAGWMFLLALIGFGTKAGLMPFHVWLPEAHPAAPSHVSALMSAVLIKTGIYGLLRALTWLGPPPAWWGWGMLVLGLGSALLGILFALAQSDLKRLLAYSSVENIGWMVAAMGLGLLGTSQGLSGVAVLGFAAALLHVVNHALFKGLLFLAAGSVVHATGTRELDRMGGLGKRMPWTAAAFLVGAVAISGLPPLNGFLSEWTLLLASWNGVTSARHGVVVGALVVVAGVALVAGLAVACFTRLFGAIFLGEPRSDGGGQPHDPGPLQRWPVLALAAGCGWVALGAPWLFGVVRGPLRLLTHQPVGEVQIAMAPAVGGATWLVWFGLVLVVLALGLFWGRQSRLRRWEIGRTVTWDCGYACPTSRMQYTASSFAQPITRMFGGLLRTRTRLVIPEGLFPKEGSLATETPDPYRGQLYQPAFVRLNEALSQFRWLQQGRVQVYVLYVAMTLVVLLVWKLH